MVFEYTQQDLEVALSELGEKYPEGKANNSKSIGSFDQKLEFSKEKYIRQSMKRSNFKNLVYDQCEFENTSFADSCFHSVIFHNSSINGNSFACCNFYKTKFYGKELGIYRGNAFNQSNFTDSKFASAFFESSGFLQTLFNKCTLTDTHFKSSTLEGSRFVNCLFKTADFGNANVEFIELTHTQIKKAVFPFYQFAYIIGIADYRGCPYGNFSFCVDEQTVSMKEYQSQIDNLILYYLDKAEYFPVCNLQIYKGDKLAAVDALLIGINNALHDLDFRMIRHFCRLAAHHDLLDEFTRRKISRTLENYIAGKNVPSERLNDCIIHIGEIQKILLGGNSHSVTLNLNVRTNVNKEDTQGVQYVNSLCNSLNIALSQSGLDHQGFQVAVSNHSPFEIAVEVIGTVASIVTIADFIWQVIDKHQTNATPKGYQQVDQDVYRNYVDDRIELCRHELLRLKESYSVKKMNKHIEEIIQNLKTDLQDLYDNDIMIFKKDNRADQ